MPKINLSPLQMYCSKWKKGCGYEQCSRANRIVLCKGTIPCNILVIGEAPGESENSLGIPFVGPAGALLDIILKKAIPDKYSVAFTNIVGCIPRDGTSLAKASEPEYEHVQACKPRLQEFVDLCQPRMVIAVGKLARENTQVGMMDSVRYPASVHYVSIVHPAWILRQHMVSRGLEVQKCVVDIEEAIEIMERPETKQERKEAKCITIDEELATTREITNESGEAVF